MYLRGDGMCKYAAAECFATIATSRVIALLRFVNSQAQLLRSAARGGLA
jgi:hypothetical protein